MLFWKKIKKTFLFTYKYFLDNKEKLLKRDIDKSSNWFAYGRSQGIQTMLNKKIGLSNILLDKIIYKELDNETLFYSGIYIIPNSEKDYKKIKELLDSKDIVEYLRNIGKPQRGGYVSFSSIDLKGFGWNE